MSSANTIPLTRTTALSQISGVVYSKPNVTANPPSACKFWAEAPANLASPSPDSVITGFA